MREIILKELKGPSRRLKAGDSEVSVRGEEERGEIWRKQVQVGERSEIWRNSVARGEDEDENENEDEEGTLGVNQCQPVSTGDIRCLRAGAAG
jgi:hypothetical protein